MVADAVEGIALSQSVRLLGDRFELVRKIGEGGFGVVYEARDLQNDASVAVKILREARAEWIDGLKREFRTLQDLKHPNLVELDELFVMDGLWFFTMELLQGEDLVRYVRPAGALDENRLRGAFSQLLSGLGALHAAGKVHRDVKPSNVLVTAGGRAVLLDFGLVSDSSQEGAPTHFLVGTPAYMSPEQIALRYVGPAADLYAVGVMLYEALTGALPFSGDPSRLLARKYATDPAPVPPALDVSPELARLTTLLLQRDASARPTAFDALRIVQDEPSARPRDSHIRFASSAPLPHFVGREAELAALEDALSRTVPRGALALRVHGVSGVGKTALIGAFCSRLRDDARALVLMGRCYERESVPFKAFDSLIDSLARRLVELEPEPLSILLPGEWSVLARLFPAFRSLPGVEPSDAEQGDPRVLRENAFATLRTLLARMAGALPLLIWLDDVQWADADSAALLNALFREPRPPRLLVILSYRQNEAGFGPFLRSVALPEGTIFERVGVRELSRVASRELAEALLPRRLGFDDELVELAVRESEGNPLFLRQLCSLVGEGQGQIPPDAALSLETVIGLRFAGLSEAGKRLLEVCAVARQPIPQSVCLRAAGAGVDGRADMAELRALHLVRTGGAASVDLVTTSHDRIAEAVVASLTAERARGWHLQIGAALEELPDADPEMLVTHFHAGGDLARAGRHAVQAAQVAASALAFDRAARLYQLALELRPHHGESEIALLVALGEALVNSGRAREAANAFLAGARRAPPELALDLQRRGGEQLLRSGHLEDGFAILDAVRAAIGAPAPKSTAGTLFSIARSSLRAALRRRGYRLRSEQDVSPRELAHVDALWSATVATGTVDTLRGAEAQALYRLRALELGEPYRVARALSMQAPYVAAGGPPKRRRFETLIEDARSAATLSGKPHAHALTLLAEGMGAWMLGEFERSRQRCLAAEAMFRDECVGVAWEISTAQVFGYNALAMRGELRELCRLSLSRRSEARERNDRYAAWIPLSGFATIAYLAQDRPHEAQAELDDVLAHWPDDRVTVQHNYASIAQVLLDIYTGTEGELLRHVRAEWRKLERSQLFRIQVVRIAFRAAVGSCAVAAANPARNRHTATALASARAITAESAPWGLPLATTLRAGVAWAEGHDARAATLLEQAIGDFDALDMSLHAAAARVRLGKILRGDAGAALVATGEGFLHRENVVDVARMVRLVVPGFSSLD